MDIKELKKHQLLRYKILDTIDEATDPDLMSKVEARDFMGDLVGDLQMKIEALQQEIEEENE